MMKKEDEQVIVDILQKAIFDYKYDENLDEKQMIAVLETPKGGTMQIERYKGRRKFVFDRKIFVEYLWNSLTSREDTPALEDIKKSLNNLDYMMIVGQCVERAIQACAQELREHKEGTPLSGEKRK